MRGFKTLALVATASVLLAGSLQAQWKGNAKFVDTYTGTRADFRSRVSSTSAWTTHRTYSSPYKASFLDVVRNTSSLAPNTLPPTWYLPGTAWGQTADIFCVDLLHYANINSNGYGANFTNLANLADQNRLTGRTTRLNDQTRYLQAAYLAQKISKEVVGNTASRYMTGAIWAIMSGRTVELSFGGQWDASGIVAQVADARANWDNGSVRASDWVVVTSRDANGSYSTADQEYITQVTPEPATMLLLGTGLVVMLMAAGALRRPVA